MSEDSASASGDSMELPAEVLIEPNDPFSNGPLSFQNGFNRGSQPYVELAEQPQQRGFRFRYRCEGPSHGGLQGIHSERGNKTYPAIRIANYNGRARILAMLVTDEKKPRTHAHELMGKHCKNGICIVEVQDTHTPGAEIQFPNLGILHVTKKKVESILVERLSELEKVDQDFTTGRSTDIPDSKKREIEKQAKDESKKMQLNVVRLKFIVYIPHGQAYRRLDPVYTNPIYDSKCPGVAGLNICRMDRNAGCCTGHEEVFLLCDKVQKDDILVRFFETDEDNQVKWEAFGNFGPSDVHRQYAIVFKTPPYMSQDINHPIHVNVQLRRISDHETSEPKPFTYYPQQLDKNEVGKKRRKTLHFPSNRNVFSSHDHRGFNFNSQNGNQSNGSNSMSGGGSMVNGNVNNCSFLPSIGLPAAGPLVGNTGSDRQVTGASASGFIIPPLTNPQSTLSFNTHNLNLNMGSLQNPQLTHNQAAPSQMAPPMMCKMPLMNIPESPLSIATSEASSLTANLCYDEIETILAQTSVDLTPTQTGPLDAGQNLICTSQSQMLPPTSMNQQIYPHQQQHQQLKQEQLQHQPMQQQQQFMQQQNAGFNINYGDTPQQPQQQQQQPSYPHHRSPYSPGQTAQFSPASSQQTYSPGAQHCYSPSMHSYSPGAQHQFSPEAAHQYSPPHQHMTQPSPPAQPIYFQASDLVMDGGDVDPDTHDRTPIQHDIECDSGGYLDDDLQEDAVPIAPEKAEAMSKDFHRTAAITAIDDKELLNDLEKMTLKEGREEERVKLEGVKEEKKATENAEEDEEQLLESVAKSGLVLAMNVARRTVVALHNYARTGDPIYMLLCQRHLVSVQDDLGDTALHMSIIHGRNDVTVQLLQAVSTLRHCAPEIVNTTNILNQTPLLLAVVTRQAGLIPPLLQLGASCHLVDKQGDSPLHLAAKMGYTDCLRHLVQKVPPTGEGDGQYADVEKLNFDGFSPLHLAVMHQHVACVKVLLEQGLDVNHSDGRSGRAALHHATEANNLTIARLILAQPDVDVDGRAYDGSTALHIGVGRKLNDLVRLLVYHNADPYLGSYERVGDAEEDDNDLCVDSEEDVSFVRPIELAADNQEMLDILLKRETELALKKGEVGQLDSNTKSALSEKLDSLLDQKEWQMLAKSLNLKMDNLKSQPSPTLLLLDKYKAGKDILLELRRVLNDMHRNDAAAFVDNCISHIPPDIRPEIKQLSKRPLASDPKSLDSGLGSISLTLNSYS